MMKTRIYFIMDIIWYDTKKRAENTFENLLVKIITHEDKIET